MEYKNMSTRQLLNEEQKLLNKYLKISKIILWLTATPLCIFLLLLIVNLGLAALMLLAFVELIGISSPIFYIILFIVTPLISLIVLCYCKKRLKVVENYNKNICN